MNLDKFIPQIIPIEKKKIPEVVEKFRKILTKIAQWAEKAGVSICEIKKLGGGFVNIVLLITTIEGKSFVVKSFTEEEEAENNKKAQEELNKISKEDEEFIPNIIEWIDGTTLISEKSEGRPLRKILEKTSELNMQETQMIFYRLGITLGNMHERTEMSLTEESKEEFRGDRQKLIKHLQQHWNNELIDITDYEIEIIKEKIISITDEGFYSLIHGDAHLDQFFFAPDKSLLTMVDYDSINYGDPMADLGRVLSSIRQWSEKFAIEEKIIVKIEQSVMAGYREVRLENNDGVELNFDQQKIKVYELRLSCIQLKRYSKIIEKIKPFKPLDLLNKSTKEITKVLNIKEKVELEDIKNFIILLKKANEIVDYLKKDNLQSKNL